MTSILFSALSAQRGGGLTYVRNIVRYFPAEAGNRLTILSAAPIEGLDPREGVDWVKAPQWTRHPITRFAFGIFYFRFLWPLRNSFDAVYYAGGSFDIALPRAIRRIVAFRNMLPFDRESRSRFPWGAQRIRLWLLRYVQASAFRRADLVIFISSFARHVIDAAIPERRGKSVVIPHGAARTGAALNPRTASELPDRFVLYLSILDAYKAQVELVRAWAKLKRNSQRPEKLVLAGLATTRYAEEVRAAVTREHLEDDVILLGSVPHDEVTDLATRAVLNVFLSSCENCPNILLELLCAGSPLLVSNREPMVELGGPDLDYVDPFDVPGIATALARLLDDPVRRARLAGAALARSRLYTWEKTAARTWAAILGIASDETESAQPRPVRRVSN